MYNSSFISKPSPHLSPQNYEPPSLDDPWLSDGLNEYYGAPTTWLSTPISSFSARRRNHQALTNSS
jgi:hypothetical protein